MLKRFLFITISLQMAFMLSCVANRGSNTTSHSILGKTTELNQKSKSPKFTNKKKLLVDVSMSTFVSNIKVPLKGAGDNHIAIALWLPHEFWKSVFDRNNNLSEANKTLAHSMMEGFSLLAVLQADTTPPETYKFYSKETIMKKMVISFADAKGNLVKLSPMHTIDPSPKAILDGIKPALESIVGNAGKNFHFFVLDDKHGSSKRLLDPYKKGSIKLQLIKRNNSIITGEIELPLNCLYVPLKCPNGRDAHISWEFCPWTGTQLRD